MRIFLAFDFEESIEKDSLEIIDRIKRSGFIGNWTKRGNFHLTLFFLGEQQKNEIVKATDAFFSELPTEAITLKSKELGMFFKNGSPSVIWLGFERERKVEHIFESGKKFYSPYGYDFKGKFIPHLTLGRLKRVPMDFRNVMNSISNQQKEYKIAGITLYQSELTSEGPVYTPLRKLY